MSRLTKLAAMTTTVGQRRKSGASVLLTIAALLSGASVADAASRVGGESIALSAAAMVGPVTAPDTTPTMVPSLVFKPQGLALSAGQVPTLLSDGKWLVSGGATARATVSSQLLVFNQTTGRVVPLATQLQVARSAHTATLLPDGTVLIHGGLDAHGVAIAQSEIFDPVSGQSTLLGMTGLLARARHAATVLSDGRILITGGVDTRGAPILAAEIFNPISGQVDVSNAGVDKAHLDASAELMSNGQVLVLAGFDAQGKPITASSLYDPITQSFSSVSAVTAQALATPLALGGAVPSVVTSLPVANAIDVGVGAQLMVRFSTRLNVATLNASSVTLIGPGGATPLKAVGVDSGVLLFVTPSQQLLPASQYTLFIQGAQDNAKRALPMFSVGFKTQTLQAASGSTGSGRGTTAAAATQTTAGGALTHSKTALSGIDEEWIPEERHRHGAWLSHRAYLAQSSLPQHPELRQVIQSSTPTVPDPIALVTAQAVSEQTPRVQRASWSEVDAHAKVANTTAKVQSLSTANGVTALTGQVLRLNGLPLAHVSMQVGAVSTYTDSNGEFLLNGIAPGNQVITINAATANRADATYGRFQYLFNVVAGKTNLLPFTIWMPKLDTKHAVHISSPTQHDTVISNPTMPGLSITLPAGTVVRDVDGKIVTEVSLTPIPVDQPPYPMPYAGVPLHYTIQPGGAIIQSVDGKPKGAVVRYPNYTSYGPGTDVKLFDYDAKGRGWYVYADAKVAPNGSDITSDRDFLIYQFGTTSYSSGGSPPGSPKPPCGGTPPDAPSGSGGWGNSSDAGAGPCGGDPVDLQYGLFSYRERDLFLQDVIPIDFTRTYRSQGSGHTVTKSFGVDTSGPYEVYLVFDGSGTRIEMAMADGSVINFVNPNGTPSGFPYDVYTYQNVDDQGSYRSAYITKDATNSTFLVTFKDGRHWGFSAFSARLIWMEDRVGNRLTLARSNVNNYVTQVVSPNGRYVNVGYNPAGFINQLTDNLGRSFTYTYGSSTPILQTVSDPNGNTRKYGWDANNFLVQVTDPNSKIMVKNTMESATFTYGCGGPGFIPSNETLGTGRVLSQQLADGSTFSYGYNSAGMVDACSGALTMPPSTTTQVTDRRTVVRKVVLDSLGNVTSNTAALGKPEQQITTSVYDPATNLLSSTTDALGRQTTFQYDANGNLKQTTRLAGTPNAVITKATYDPVFNQPWTLTDGNNHTTTLGYDPQGNLTSVKDALGHTTTIGRDPQGRVGSVTTALSKTTLLTYSGADLASIKDPLGRQTQFLTDAVGRVMTQIDGLGNRTYQSWDPLNRLSQITDALGGLTRFGYDNNGNVLTQTDANSHTTTFTYNGIGQVETKKDALLNVETSLYEPGGLLKQRTDRKGQVSGVTYDNLGRVATIGFGATAASPTAYTSTATLTWDAGNRLTKIVDVQAGKTTTITRTFDGLNRMTSEVTEQGEVDYTYDNGGRRATMTVKNGPSTAQVVTQSLTYTFDDANRLTKIVQSAGPVNNSTAQPITFVYDNANRMTLQTESTGLNIGYTYTDADEIQSITYKTPTGTVIHSGSYTYDAAGHRTSVTGDLATFVQASGTDVTDAAYNANNQLMTWSGKSFGYDKNGSMTSDGTNTYTWDARGQLTAVTGATPATFQYDTQRRRLAKTIGGATTAYLYDEDNFVQELAGLGNTTAINANLITGGTDQTFLRSTGTGSTATLHWVLPDANNNVIALTDNTGTVQKSYAYDSYGNTAPGAGADSNSQQYTGRENDGTGLYFYRNRYYMPACNRFISEDPIGWASGQTNNYAYVAGNPISLSDPYGLSFGSSLGCFASGALHGAIGAVAVGAFAVGAVTFGAPIAVVTAGLGVFAIAGSVIIGADIGIGASLGNWDKVAYDVGSMVGGFGTGLGADASFGRAVAEGINGVPSGPFRWNDSFQNYNRNMGSIWDWLGTGPNPGSAGLAAGAAGAGASVSLGAPVSQSSGCQ